MVQRTGAPTPSDRRSWTRCFEGWVALAMGLHAAIALSTRALLLPSEMSELAASLRRAQRELFATTADVEAAEPAQPVPPPPPAPEEPSPVLPPPPPPPAMARPRPLERAAPPPEIPAPINDLPKRAVAAIADAVAEAAKVLTREDDTPGAVAIASGDSDKPTSGYVAGAGTGTVSTFDPRASTSGKPGGRGTATGPEAAVSPDLSRRARVIGAFAEECAFPEAADIAGIDHATAVVVVKVRANGTAASVTVVSDPGHGFGEAARRCAFQMRYVSARDRAGRSIDAETGAINVRFTR